ncbi:uncharacterized protein METZ01_LOCUS492188 [marine metagenome]|uniref:Uncharacterized protein n=1 Tax=marine metagenome TaxID=408172 RepID=A0A383D4V4_9ZZZZ
MMIYAVEEYQYEIILTILKLARKLPLDQNRMNLIEYQ